MIRATTTPGVTFIILNVGGCHWVLLIIDNRISRVYFFDPLGHSCPASISRILIQFFPTLLFIDLCTRLQFESFQCGVWVCWICETILDHLKYQITIDEIPWKELICTRKHGLVLSHNLFIANTRERYSDVLIRAFQRGTLNWT